MIIPPEDIVAGQFVTIFDTSSDDLDAFKGDVLRVMSVDFPYAMLGFVDPTGQATVVNVDVTTTRLFKFAEAHVKAYHAFVKCMSCNQDARARHNVKEVGLWISKARASGMFASVTGGA